MLRMPDWSACGRLAVCSLVLGIALTGCGGDDESDPSPMCTELQFSKALNSFSPGDVFLRQSPLGNCSTVDIEVAISNLSGIWTISFDLLYPSSLVDYESITLGPLLQQGSPVNAPLVIVNEGIGSVQVTITRLPPDPSVTAVGGETLATLRFRRIASSGSDLIDFDFSPGSPVGETILDEFGVVQPATFGPGHGGIVMVP